MLNYCHTPAICISTLVLVLSGCSGPSPQNEGVNWSHSELISHLKEKGLNFNASETHLGAFWGPAMNFDFGIDGEVYVQVRKTAQEAKDAASPKGERAFSWGRFYFDADPKILTMVRQALQ